jgi:hypothetical protein
MSVVLGRSLGSWLLDRRRARGGCPQWAPRGGRRGWCGWSHGRAGWRLHLRTVTRHDGRALVLTDDGNNGGWRGRWWWCVEWSAGKSRVWVSAWGGMERQQRGSIHSAGDTDGWHGAPSGSSVSGALIGRLLWWSPVVVTCHWRLGRRRKRCSAQQTQWRWPRSAWRRTVTTAATASDRSGQNTDAFKGTRRRVSGARGALGVRRLWQAGPGRGNGHWQVGHYQFISIMKLNR